MLRTTGSAILAAPVAADVAVWVASLTVVVRASLVGATV